MKIPTNEAWQSLDEIAKDTKTNPKKRMAAAVALVALYRYIVDTIKTERVGDGVPTAPGAVDSVDKKTVSTVDKKKGK
ncbi:hypothetical protein [Haliscomenobacter hydrossis]|uniref:Uncharacterized protein n=1 Tax=Haliscomenobacter hydrossis (strain ATCC 27775 / DSM 1100 / LMG 10767 / O) TaxID=760192 RepID=F4L093_HALH1|nr:hypothetical protein [Haliscomenobacter hydrossis]AEE53766.1 hypothetical protein Halhy_5943 [Haliscomenobacter hydrossis DSM 1100]